MTINSDGLVHKLHAGGGRIVLSVHGKKAVFSELSSTYPLKLLSPNVQGETALVYLLSYGGGLVSGDQVDLRVEITGGSLMLLSQGSTKVFKSRPGKRLASVKSDRIHSSLLPHDSAATPSTRQNLEFHLAPMSTLFLLPEPVTCFRDASYNQIQRFYLQEDSSAVILDWITSGRMSVGEEWVFSRYHSLNEIFLGGKRVAKDVMLLDIEDTGVHDVHIPHRPLRDRLQPYSCYAMLILYGPQMQSVIADITAKYNNISVFKTRQPDTLIWSLSPVDSKKRGAVVRVAGLETEMVKEWLKQTLAGFEDVVGKDLYRRAFP
ncbi:Urease accessory protein D [Psilocybe cubensis]|uniref:UreD-domain-containing protein n=2 Tax=Psilocybe cubensis TaxID=181762 RepID=A0A8H7YAW1_PSICU|nr:Urease accessory protein D [Psilocybe cubensis]KAH9486620.1 Urease accessory protein D [Psilocybe cubensis]